MGHWIRRAMCLCPGVQGLFELGNNMLTFKLTGVLCLHVVAFRWLTLAVIAITCANWAAPPVLPMAVIQGVCRSDT